MDEKQLLLLLLRAEICGAPIDVKIGDSIPPETLQNLYVLAMRQDLAHIAGQALSKANLLGNDPVSEKLKSVALQAVLRFVRLNHDYAKTCETLENAGIPFIPLKGAVLREYYPEPWMRTSCDTDILVKEENLKAAVQVLREKLGYQSGGRSDHDVVLKTPSGALLELHYDTIQERYANGKSRDVLGEIWQDAYPVKPGSVHLRMSDPMFYFYHMAHMAKHFEVGGCGVRPFLDIWIMNHRMEHDKQARKQLLEAGGLWKFAKAAEALAEAWFSEAPMDEMTGHLQDYIFRAGLYGDEANRAALGQAKNGGKIRYVLFRRIFMPYAYLKAEYPILEKKKWLTPFYQVVRWRTVLKRKDTARRVAELKVNASVSGKATAAAAKLLRHLGL